MEKLICDCCKKNETQMVYASRLGPISYAFCQECMDLNIEPIGAVKYILFAIDYEHLDDYRKDIVDKSLKFHGVSLEDAKENAEIHRKGFKELIICTCPTPKVTKFDGRYCEKCNKPLH